MLTVFSFSKSNPFINGVDISMLKQVEENGGIFYENGNQIDPIPTFKDKGVNQEVNALEWDCSCDDGQGNFTDL